MVQIQLGIGGWGHCPSSTQGCVCWNSILSLISGDQLEEYRAHTLSQSLTMSPKNMEASFLVNSGEYQYTLPLPFADPPP